MRELAGAVGFSPLRDGDSIEGSFAAASNCRAPLTVISGVLPSTT